MENVLVGLSDDLATAVERAGPAIVAVHARPRVSSSGVQWRPGVIVTADHTIRRDDEIRITLADGRKVAAELAGRDPSTDIAVLSAPELLDPVVEFSTGEDLRPGALALTLGRGEETGISATMGVISSVSGTWRTWRGGRIDQFVRLDAALYPGSSGGAVVDVRGRILGIATSGLSRTAAICIPVSTVDRVVKELLDSGHIRRGWLGVGLQPVAIPDHLRQKWNREERSAIIVLSVEPGSPADHAGILLGDILLTLDGKPLSDAGEIQNVLTGDAIGQQVEAVIIRAGEVTSIKIVVAERPRKGE